MIYIIAFLEFFKIGLFAVGGGLATLPFLYDLAEKYGWFTPEMIGVMLAVSESTPGPIGINMATYTGFRLGGVGCGITTTLGLVMPSVIIICIISEFLVRFKESKWVERIFSGIRPCVVGLIGAVALQLVVNELSIMPSALTVAELLDIRALLLLVVLVLIIYKTNRHPIVYIGASAVIGMIFSF